MFYHDAVLNSQFELEILITNVEFLLRLRTFKIPQLSPIDSSNATAETDQSLNAQQEKLYLHGDSRIGLVDASGVHVKFSAEQVSQQTLLSPAGLSKNISSSCSSSRRVFAIIHLNCITSTAPQTCTNPITNRLS